MIKESETQGVILMDLITTQVELEKQQSEEENKTPQREEEAKTQQIE